MAHAERIAWLVLLVVCLFPAPADGEWRIWPDFVERTNLRLDQKQTSGSDGVVVFEKGEKGIGQTFRPALAHLHRIDVQVRNRGDERPARIRLWRWQGSQSATERTPPLFEDVLGVAGVRHTWHTRSTFPDLVVEPGAIYYFRLDAQGRYDLELRSSRSGTDGYPPGRLVARHLRDRPSDDLWFQTWSRVAPDASPADAPRPVPHPSEPVLRWNPPPHQPVPVRAREYLARVEQYTQWLRDIESGSCGAHDDAGALLEAFLYRLSCETTACREELARNAVGRLHRFLQWKRCDFSNSESGSCGQRCRSASPGHLESLDQALDAFAMLQGSPSRSPALADDLRAFLVQRVDELWPMRQLGTGSRALAGASVALRLAKLFPDEPGADSWRAYARSVWSDFRDHVEYQGASASYAAGAFWPAVLRFADETDGAVELWRDPRFRNLVDRYFHEVAPLGVLPSYGDAVGWGTDSPGLVWLFEEAAARTGDGRYRWLAHRLFQYNRERVRDDPPRHDSWGPKMHHLARAYVAARRWEGPAEPPKPARVKRFVSSTLEPAQWWDLAGAGQVGQTFVHPGGSVARIDLRIRGNDADRTRVRLWRWKGDLRTTRARTPIHSARLVRSRDEVFSALPILPSDPVTTYYFELEGVGTDVRVGVFEKGPYAEGRAFGPPADAGADLWLETYAATGMGSLVTHRLASDELPVSEWERPVRTQRFKAERVPDKLVLRSGWLPTDLFALVNLLSGYRHGQPSLGAFSAVIDHGGVILGETSFPYWEHTRRPEEENVALVRRFRGGRAEEPGRSVEITRFVDTPNLTVAWLRFRDMEGFGVEQERRIHFVKNRFIWVRDRFELPPDLLAGVGTVWHPDVVIAPKPGEKGHRIAYPHPLQNVWPVHNPPRFARLWMPEHAGTVEVNEIMIDHAPSPRCMRLVEGSGPIPADCRISPAHALHRSWTGHSGERRRVWIDTVLVPEGPNDWTGLETLLVEGQTVALAVTTRGERWILLDNPERHLVRAGGLWTDALYAFLREEADDGPYLHAAETTRLEGAGLALSSEAPSSTERGAFAP